MDPQRADAPKRTGIFTAEEAAFYRAALDTLTGTGIPHLVGGAYAMQIYTDLERHTKDLDVFLRQTDVPRVLGAFESAGYRTEVTFPHWLAKVYQDDILLDLIHGSGNGLCNVDDSWFARAVKGSLLGREVQACSAEDMIWSKAFIMERERFDGADIAHLLLWRAQELDWPHLIARFGPHWRVLLAHLVLFGYVYPGERWRIPEKVLRELSSRLHREEAPAPLQDQVCRGPLISRAQYLPDLERWGYRDARLQPDGPLTAADIELWTEPVDDEDRPH